MSGSASRFLHSAQLRAPLHVSISFCWLPLVILYTFDGFMTANGSHGEAKCIHVWATRPGIYLLLSTSSRSSRLDHPLAHLLIMLPLFEHISTAFSSDPWPLSRVLLLSAQVDSVIVQSGDLIPLQPY